MGFELYINIKQNTFCTFNKCNKLYAIKTDEETNKILESHKYLISNLFKEHNGTYLNI